LTGRPIARFRIDDKNLGGGERRTVGKRSLQRTIRGNKYSQSSYSELGYEEEAKGGVEPSPQEGKSPRERQGAEKTPYSYLHRNQKRGSREKKPNTKTQTKPLGGNRGHHPC